MKLVADANWFSSHQNQYVTLSGARDPIFGDSYEAVRSAAVEAWGIDIDLIYAAKVAKRPWQL